MRKFLLLGLLVLIGCGYYHGEYIELMDGKVGKVKRYNETTGNYMVRIYDANGVTVNDLEIDDIDIRQRLTWTEFENKQSRMRHVLRWQNGGYNVEQAK